MSALRMLTFVSHAPLPFRLLNFSFKKLSEISFFPSALFPFVSSGFLRFRSLWDFNQFLGGGEYRDRTGDLLLARQALSQLS